jgi:integral membrane sensor domain MASE1
MLTGLQNNLKVGIWEYDFAKDGGAVSAIALRGPKLPVGAIILAAFLDIETAFVGAGSSSAFHVTGANDIYSEAVVGTYTLDALLKGVPDFATVGDAVRVATAAKGVTHTITGAVLTAGKANVICCYILPR